MLNIYKGVAEMQFNKNSFNSTNFYNPSVKLETKFYEMKPFELYYRNLFLHILEKNTGYKITEEQLDDLLLQLTRKYRAELKSGEVMDIQYNNYIITFELTRKKYLTYLNMKEINNHEKKQNQNTKYTDEE